MTQRELDKIARRYAQYELKDNHASVEDIVAAAFLDGIDYAEHHPNWISVEDELPPYGQQVLAYSEHNPWAEMWWSERNIEYDAKFGKSGEYLILHDNNGFATLRDDDNKPIQVTHWMRIEPPAVLSGLERTEKKWGRIEYGQ